MRGGHGRAGRQAAAGTDTAVSRALGVSASNREIDARIKIGKFDPEAEPFLGVPITVKVPAATRAKKQAMLPLLTALVAVFVTGLFDHRQESIPVSGMPQTAGFVPRSMTHAAVEKDATVVERLRKAGFVILGVTNTSELCFWSECNNHLYGRSLNPYDPRRTTGGSSGGEGGIIGSVR